MSDQTQMKKDMGHERHTFASGRGYFPFTLTSSRWNSIQKKGKTLCSVKQKHLLLHNGYYCLKM